MPIETNAVTTRKQFELPFGLTEDAQQVFTTTEILAKDGTVVGCRLKQHKNAEIAVMFGLQPKKDMEAISDRKHAVKEKLLVEFKKWLAGANGDWMLERATARMVKGRKSLTINMVEELKATVDDVKIAKAWFSEAQFPGMTLEEKVARVQLMRETELATLAKNGAEGVVEVGEVK
jgi:hypothetical protein